MSSVAQQSQGSPPSPSITAPTPHHPNLRFAQMYAGSKGPPPRHAVPGARVVHDSAERVSDKVRAHRSEEANRGCTEWVGGIMCGTTRDRSGVVHAYAPDFSAKIVQQSWTLEGRCGFFDAVTESGFTADHTFQRRTPQPGDGGDDPIKQTLATCHGCVARGWHLPETDISCSAFGVQPPPPPPTEPGDTGTNAAPDPSA